LPVEVQNYIVVTGESPRGRDRVRAASVYTVKGLEPGKRN